MKQKKQTRKIKQWLAAALGVTLLGTGLWVGVNEEKLQAKPKSDISFSPKAVEDEPWLPKYNPEQGQGLNNGGWLDATKNMIPKEYSFVLQYLYGKTSVDWDKTSEFIKEHKDDEPPHSHMPEAIRYDSRIEQTIYFNNVGFYQDGFVDVKVLLTPIDPTGIVGAGAININNDNNLFLNVVFDPKACESVDVRFEFYEHGTTTPVTIGGYWTLGTIQIGKEITIEKSLIKNIYSLSRTYQVGGETIPTEIQFAETATELHLLGVTSLTTLPEETAAQQIETTITYNSDYFKFTMSKPLSNPNMYTWQTSYAAQSIAKVEFPAPYGRQKRYTEVIANGKNGILAQGANPVIEALNTQMIQPMPWESKLPALAVDNRTQTPTWNFASTDNELQALHVADWKISTLDNETLAVQEFFTGSALTDPLGNGAVTSAAGSLENTNFYNHYYDFYRATEVSYAQADKVTRDQLTEEDGKYYVSQSGTVGLSVTDTNPIAGYPKPYAPADYDTAINFYAPIEYKYIDSITKAEIPASSLPTTATATGDGIVTWDAPLTPMSFEEYGVNGQIPTEKTSAPTIAGYTFKTATFNGDSVSSESLAQVKVTKRLKNGGDATKAEDYTQNNVVILEYQPVYTVDVQVGALDTDGKFGTIPFAPSTGTSEPYVTVQETTAPTTPENAISPTGTEPAAEFTFPTTYDFEVGTGKGYKVTQMENVNNDYTKPNQATSPVFSINDQNQLVVDGNVVSNSTYQGEDFILSWDATNKKLTIQIINQPNGEYQLVSVEPLEYGKVSLPQKNPNELIKRQDANWKIQFTDTRLDAYRTPLKLSVKLDQNFTNTNDPTKTISGILLYRPEEATPITPDDFLIEGEEIPIKEKINPDSGTNDIDWPEQAGFLLQIDAEKQTKIFAGDYQAELTFILSEDPL